MGGYESEDIHPNRDIGPSEVEESIPNFDDELEWIDPSSMADPLT